MPDIIASAELASPFLTSFESPEEDFFRDISEHSLIVTRRRKRRRISSSCDESPEKDRSVSPEITYDSPASYRVQQYKGNVLIVKVPMNREKRRTRCSDQDITNMLYDESETERFENDKKMGVQVVGTLPQESRSSESPRRRMPKKIRRTVRSGSTDSALDSDSDCNSPKKEQGSIKMRLRRSTEQSNYKVHTIFEEENTRVRTPRSTAGTFRRSGIWDQYEFDEIKKTRTTPRTPRSAEVSRNEIGTPTTRRTRTTPSRMMKIDENSLENGSERNSNDENSEFLRRSRRTPRITKVAEAAKTPTTRRTRMSVLNGNVIDYRESESNNDSDPNFEISPRKRRRNLVKTDTPLSARRTSRAKTVACSPLKNRPDKENKAENDVDENSDSDSLFSDSSKRKSSRFLNRQNSRSLMETPQKHVKIAEVRTPKRTPRREVEKKLEELAISKTPRKSRTSINEPATPTSSRRVSKVNTPSMRSGNLTPSMSRRIANISKPSTTFDVAKEKLHVSVVPKSLPCREAEFNDIYQFLERKLLDESSGCIYISGVPGTGKTATVNEVVRCLTKLVAKNELDPFDFIKINGLQLSEPRQAYVQILKQMNGQSLTWEQAYRALDKHFTQSTKKRPMTLLMVDELDILCNKRQDVIYNLLDWPSKANARLVVITIANTMDLPERVLMGRVTSRLGLTRLKFQPYNHKQLQEIVMARLKDNEDAFKSEAVQLVARKVAAVSGDARRALDICRRATEIAELNNGSIVTMQNMNEALTEMICSVKVRAIKHCSLMEKMFLQAVSAEVTRTGVEETNFRNVYVQLYSLCCFEGYKAPNLTEAFGICAKLGAYRLLLTEHSRTDMEQRILLNVSTDDINFAMENTSAA